MCDCVCDVLCLAKPGNGARLVLLVPVIREFLACLIQTVAWLHFLLTYFGLERRFSLVALSIF